MPLTVLYPGTFDPVTLGHVDLVRRAARLCNKIVVAVSSNEDKRPFFPLEKRMEMVEAVLHDIDSVIEVCSFDTLTVDLARQKGATAILRGLRAISDFEYEFQLASLNRHLAPEIETVFLTPAEQYSYISSSMVREIARMGGDVSNLVPDVVAKALRETG
ncbi:MAG TPA: pantetheine-phosphate adenylyltransferase [Chromatiales bacterium]|nr:pantetheine-phosphate adenylyltransferase [Thiotrichales bacterium]HIP67181.1 pantetheine-phosphate adenylyltransferase [Chromatiales bacterium]